MHSIMLICRTIRYFSLISRKLYLQLDYFLYTGQKWKLSTESISFFFCFYIILISSQKKKTIYNKLFYPNSNSLIIINSYYIILHTIHFHTLSYIWNLSVIIYFIITYIKTISFHDFTHSFLHVWDCCTNIIFVCKMTHFVITRETVVFISLNVKCLCSHTLLLR